MVKPSALAVLRLTMISTFARLPNRKLAGLLALEDLTSVDAGQTVRVGETSSIAYSSACRGKVTRLVDGYRITECQNGEFLASDAE
jgi:hypothetical protein